MVGFNRPKVDLFFRIYEDELHRLGENVDPTRLWNMDEVGVQNVQKPNKLLVQRGRGRWQESQVQKEALLSLLPVP